MKSWRTVNSSRKTLNHEFSLLFYRNGMETRSLGIAVSNDIIIPASENRWVWSIDKIIADLTQCHFILHKFHIDYSGTEHGPPWCELQDGHNNALGGEWDWSMTQTCHPHQKKTEGCKRRTKLIWRFYLLGYKAVYFGGSQLTFQRNISPPPSGLKQQITMK